MTSKIEIFNNFPLGQHRFMNNNLDCNLWLQYRMSIIVMTSLQPKVYHKYLILPIISSHRDVNVKHNNKYLIMQIIISDRDTNVIHILNTYIQMIKQNMECVINHMCISKCNHMYILTIWSMHLSNIQK